MMSKRSKDGREFKRFKSSTDETTGQQRALPVSEEVLKSINKSTVPQDAETYLAMVRLESESLADVVFVPKELDYDEPVDKSEDTSRISYDISVKDLSEEDEALVKELDLKSYEMPECGELPIPADFKFPNNFTEWRKFLLQNKPEISLVSNFDQQLIIKLMIYSIQWVNNTTPEQLIEWIENLLLKLNSFVLETKDIAVIRDLGSKTKKLILKGKTQFRVILIIVSQLFGQKDLYF